MKLNWGTKKLTFMVIREANQSVIRFSLRSFVLYLIPIILLLSAAAIYILYQLYTESYSQSRNLEIQLQEENIEHYSILQEKDQTIEKLMSDIVNLTNQTELIQEKLNELQNLGDQIRIINGESTSAADPDTIVALSGTKGPVTAASLSGSHASAYLDEDEDETTAADKKALLRDMLMSYLYPYDVANGQGGSYNRVTADEVLSLAQDTLAELEWLSRKMDELKTELEEARNLAIEYQHKLRITPSIWPTTSQKITSTFGYRRDPFTRRLSYHSGIDIGGKKGDPVYVTADGKVIESSYDRSLGHHIVVDHTGGVRTVYAHLSKRLVNVGDVVEKGDLIGNLGSTGRSTGPHLHYEVYLNGTAVNPKTYLP
jgi:murein DD-endopeptidase MepM/ murein hydrolase activator NlpD